MSFVPSAVSEPRWVLDMFDDKCATKGFKFFGIAAILSEKRRRIAHDQLLQKLLSNTR